MAIVAIKVDRTIRPQQFCPQVCRVIELDGAWIKNARPECGKFGMSGAKTLDVVYELSRSAYGEKVRVALRAICVSCGCEALASPMFRVAGGAIWRERLIGMVRGAIMTSAAGLVVRLGAEGANLLHVAFAASCREDSMPGGHLAAAIDAIVARKRCPAQPDDRERRQ